jgi:Ricin-type beta-trefoil lectin domain/Putative Ig domain
MFMRRSIRVSRNRMLAIGASILLFGSALAAAAIPAQAARHGQAAGPAQAAPLVAFAVTVANPGLQTIDPLSTAVDLAIGATDTDVTGPPLTFTATGLPPGLGIAPTDTTDAAITGTITAAGTYSVTVTATDQNNVAGSAAAFTWTAGDASAVQVNAPATEMSTVGTAIAPVIIGATGGTTPGTYTYSVSSPPAGLTYTAATHTIAGTPTGKAKVYDVAVSVTDGTTTSDATIVWTVQNKVTVTAKVPKKVYLRIEVKVQPTVTDSDPSQQLTWSVSAVHALPTGLTINAKTGLISGRPTVLQGAPTTVVIATDAAGSTGSATINWVVSIDGYLDFPGPESVTVGVGKDLVLKEADYVPGDKMTWKATGLPAGTGLMQNPLMIYGWPTTAGTKSVNIQGYGTLGARDWMTFKLVVKPATGKGATGPIRLALDGKCLQDPGSKTANGTRIQLQNCASGVAERWTVASDGTLRVNGRCLDIAGSGSSAGRQLQLQTCGNANPRQVWRQGTHGELVNPSSGLCVADPGSSQRNGTVPVMSACHVKSAEQWTLPAHPILTSVGGSCADDHFSAGNNGAIVDMFWCNDTTGQAWSFRPDGTIRAGLYSNACLTVRGKLGAVGTKIVLWTCSASNEGQKWAVTPTGDLGSEIRLGGVCLGITSMTAANATQLVTGKCTASDPRVHWNAG